MASILLRFSSIVLSRCSRRIEHNITRAYASALFIPGNKASDNFAYLSPYLDMDERFKDLDKLRKELEQRGTQINAEELAKSWRYYKSIEANKCVLEQQRIDNAWKIKSLKKKTGGNSSGEDEKEIEKLMIQAKVIRQDVKTIKEALWEMEESIIVTALKLPNVLDDKTPSESPMILRTVGETSEPSPNERKCHIEIGTSLGLIDYKNPMNYYLCDEAAFFELGVLSYVGNYLANMGMFRVAGTDFGRSLVVEGSGQDHEDLSKVFTLWNNEDVSRETSNRLHLVGGASLVSFLSMHTKQLINPNHFPLKYFSTGRQYKPFVNGTNANGLFTVCQASVIETFLMVKDPTSIEHTNEFDNLMNIYSSLYDSLDVHYRTVLRSAKELNSSESLRISYEMWSSNLQEYVEIGHISVCGTYISKRLLIAYQTPTGRGFPAIISGTLLSIPKLLGCLLEQNPNTFKIPLQITQHMRGFN